MARTFSNSNVALGVGIILMLTAVVPPAGAYALATWRISRTTDLAGAAAAVLATDKQALHDAARGADIVAGPGRLPRAADRARGWISNPVTARATFAGRWPADAWGRCYLLNVRQLSETGSGLLLSAGPNGEIDTPLDAAAPHGDDIAATVR